jgi:NNP family nitrate/nitrite transporter-like MFS transporter
MGVAASANSGTVLAMWFAPRLQQVVGWHGVFGLMALPILGTLALFAWLVRAAPSASRQERRPRWWATRPEMLRHRFVYWLCFMYGMTFGGFVGLSSFLPIFFHDQYGWDLITAGSLTALCGLAGSGARPFGGYVADRVGGLRVLQAVFLVIAGLIVAVAQLPGRIWVALLMIAALTVMGFGNGVVFQVVSGRYQKQIGMASGLIGAAGGLGGFLLPAWLGLLKDMTGTYRSGFWLFAILAVVASWSVAAAIRRSRLAAASGLVEDRFPD